MLWSSKVKGEQVITLQMTQQLKKRNINVVPGQLFCRQCKANVNDLVRLHEAMQAKLKTASYSEQIQILTLGPDKWSQMYCSEYFNVFKYLV